MEIDPSLPLEYKTSDKDSSAWPSVCERWPVIVTQMIDGVFQSTSKAKEPVVIQEGKVIVSNLSLLKYEIEHDRPVTPLQEDGRDDISLYNSELIRRGDFTWYNAPCLFVECYLYRRVQTLFANALSPYWNTYDVFRRSKLSSIKFSRTAIVELAAQYRAIVERLNGDGENKAKADITRQEKKVLFQDMCEICLWGNKTDLSLLPHLSEADTKLLQGSEARKAAESNILVNDIPKAFDLLYAASTQENKNVRRVDIVLDNAGFELFVDLIFAGYLLSTGLATTVILHPKSFPWYVSDVIIQDFADLLDVLREPNHFFGAGSDGIHLADEQTDNVTFFFNSLINLNAEGGLIMRPNTFWTQGVNFWRMPTVAPDLFADLKDSELVIFKGDLNYRKLTCDAKWDSTTKFELAIGPLGGESGIRVLCLRTVKVDVVVDLPPGKDTELRAAQGSDPKKRTWATTGQWAVCSFHDGKQNK